MKLKYVPVIVPSTSKRQMHDFLYSSEEFLIGLVMINKRLKNFKKLKIIS